MLNLNRSNFKAYTFCLVSASLWPLYTSLSLLSLTTSAVLSFHGFVYVDFYYTGAESFFTVVESTTVAAEYYTTYVKANSSLNKLPLGDESIYSEHYPYFENGPFYDKCTFCDKCPFCEECTFCKCEESTPSDQGPFSDHEPFINSCYLVYLWEGDASLKLYRDVLDNNTSFLHFKIYNMRLII